MRRDLNLETFEPPALATHGHVQTILGHVLPQAMLTSKGRRIEVKLSDGDRLVGFVSEGSSSTAVSLFHGLAGSTDSSYMHRTSRLLQQRGHTVFMFNHRGCGEGAGLASGPYHSGRGEDLAEALKTARQIFPRKRHVAIGFSMSANALLCLVTGQRGEFQPDAALAVNAPLNLRDCAQSLMQGFNRIYDARFYQQCRRDVFEGLGRSSQEFSIGRYGTLYQFDQDFTAPAGGFKNRDDFYDQCSPYRELHRVQTPTILLTAADDPFVPIHNYLQAELSPAVRLHVEKHGGHMGYIARQPTALGTRRWLDYAIDTSLNAF